MKNFRNLLFLLLLSTLSSCSIIDACFNSHLAREGKKYNKYGKKSKSGSKSLSSRKPSSKYGGKVKSSDVKKYDKNGKLLPNYASNVDKPVGKRYSKAQLKAIERQNKKLHKHNKKGKGKFRYPYQIPSPDAKEANKEKKENKKE